MLSSIINRSTGTGNDSTNVYNYNYRLFSASDLKVTVRNTATGVEYLLVLTNDYTVSGVGQVSGSITLVNANQIWIDSSGYLATGFTITIRRIRPLSQNTSIRNQGSFYAATHEDTFDNLTMIAQQHDDDIGRAVSLSETTTPAMFNPVLPPNIAGQGNVMLITNPLGNGWSLTNPITGISWQYIDIPFASLWAGALTNIVNAFALPAGCILLGATVKHRTAFAGPSISDVYVDLGISTDANKFISEFDVAQAVSDTAFDYDLPNYIGSWANGTEVTLKATSSGANLSALTAGLVRVYYWYMFVGV